MNRKVSIIGAGPGGLAAAMLLAKAGVDVTVHEARDRIGGRSSAITGQTPQGRFRFDTGPTFFLYPRVLADIFTACGRNLDDEVELIRLDPQYHLVFEGGGDIQATGDMRRMEAEIARFSPNDARAFHRFMDDNRAKLAAFRPVLEGAFNGMRDLMRAPVLKGLSKLRPHRSVDSDLGTYFKDERIRLAFSFQSKYLGMSPFRCPSLFTILSFMEYEYGVYHPRGGTGSVMAAMARVARDLGARIELNDRVEQLVFDGRRARGVRTRRGTTKADALVIGSDFAQTMTTLVPDAIRRRWTDRKIATKKFSCSTFMLYLGIEGQLPDLSHHTIYLADDYRENLRQIEAGLAPDYPSLYVQNACVTDPALAPPGHSTLYVLVPVGHRMAGSPDWAAETQRYRKLTLERLKKLGIPDLESRIRFEKIMTPQGWEDELQVYHGATFNLSHNLAQMLHFRPRNRFEDLDGVYLVGGGTHPGSGLPVIFESARISTRLMAEDLGSTRPGRRRPRWPRPTTYLPSRRPYELHAIPSELLPVGVVGAGLAGLAAACTLAARGHKVILFDKNPWLGGKAAQLQEEGFRFDMGPTILTVPHVLDRVFQEAGRSMHDYLDLRRLDPQWRCFFDDGAMLDLVEDVPEMAASVARFAPGNEQGFRDFIAMSKKLHEVSEKFFFWKSVEGIADTLSFKGMNLATLKDVLSLRMGTSVASQIRKRVPDGRVSQMLDHFVQYVGSSPYASPAVLCSIGHMQTDLGVWYPIGGTRAVPQALEKLAGELGVDLRPGTDVTRITMENGRATGVVTEGGEVIRLSAVVSNMDSVRTMRELVQGPPAAKFARRWKRDPACSGVVLYLGLDRGYDHLAHHDFVFSKDPAEEFNWIYDRGEPAPDPTAYIAATARTEPGVAPPGGEALYVLVHTPFLRPHHDWQAMFPAYRQVILDKLKRCAGMPDLEERIVFERHLTPQDIHDRYRVLNGAIYGLASHGKVNGAFKPGNRSRDLAGLYLAGGAAHPGPGMPMVLMSGWIAADSLCQDMQQVSVRADAR